MFPQKKIMIEISMWWIAFTPRKKEIALQLDVTYLKLSILYLIPDCLVNHNRDDELLVLAIYQNEQKYAIDLINGKHIRL